MLLIPAPAWAYRPFVSTDATVADLREVEIELGYFNLERDRRANTIATPDMVVNYGVAKNVELVGQFRLDVSPEVEITDAALSLKGIVREGVLQDKPGPSVAVEAGPLLPSTRAREHRIGFEAIAIVSGRLAPLTVHVNGGGGLDRGGHVFGIWGVIGELPLNSRLRLVGEVNGQTTEGERPDTSALLGLIWQASKNLSLDAGVRHGISHAAADWQFTLGLTFGFSLRTFSRQ